MSLEVQTTVQYPACYGPANRVGIQDYRYIVKSREQASRIRIARIIALVAHYSGVTADDLRGARRMVRFVKPRHEVMYLARVAGWSTPQIGRALGGRDHATVIHGARKHAARHGLPVAWVCLEAMRSAAE